MLIPSIVWVEENADLLVPTASGMSGQSFMSVQFLA
jgi:hypothetical protein